MMGRQTLTSLFILPVIVSLRYLGWVSGSSQENQSSGRHKLLAQKGFISIDCGIATGSHYTDAETGIEYMPDADFIDTGINKAIAQEYFGTVNNQQLQNVRSFPEGERNCYTLRPEQGKNHKYLIRAWFLYGNYDSKNQLPSFKLYLGVDEWDVINISYVSETCGSEIIHVPVSDHIDVCLVNTGMGIPFISTLELRQLNDLIYSPSQPGSLLLYGRWDLGRQQGEWNTPIREKDDVYDRIWALHTQSGWKSINSPLANSSLSASDYKLPENVVATAATPADESEISFDLIRMQIYPSLKLFIYLHFAEVMDLEGQTREFTISVNNQSSFGGPLVPSKDNAETRYNNYSISVSTPSTLSISLKRTNRSTLPPLINAFEIYNLKEDFSLASTQQSDVDAVKTIKYEYAVSKNWQGDPCLPVVYQWQGVTCSNDSSPALISLNLSYSNLLGTIRSSFSSLQSLQSLDLSYNHLTGPVPNFFTDMPHLTMLNLTGNNLTGSVPQAVWDKFEDGTLSLGENPYLCLNHSCQRMTEEKKEKNFLVPVVVPILSIVVILIIIIAALAMIIQKLRMRKTNATTLEMATEFPKLEQLKSGNCEFTYLEVIRMTDNFRQVIGRGGFGEVYLGSLAEGTQVAVKVRSKLSVQGPKAFLAEAKLLMRVHHKNLVSLIGYCNDGMNMALIYEYMSNGNLQMRIFGRDTAVLSWKHRLQIVLDTAQGLEYLHNGCKPPIMHRDMKSSNILLNETLQAKISDFGMSRHLATESGTLISTTPAGTPGYLDPEFHLTGILNTKSDVYSFGIVLLEVITGRPVRKNPGSIHVVAWVSMMIDTGDVRTIVDPRLHGDFSTSSAWKAVETAMACVAPTGMERPDMSYVVTDLKECLEIEMASRRIPGAGGYSHGSDDLPEGCPLVDSTESVPQAR